VRVEQFRYSSRVWYYAGIVNESQLALLLNFIRKFIKNIPSWFTLVLLEFDTFDCLIHLDLLSKLERYGVRGLALSWVDSYLQERPQCVRLRGCKYSKLIIWAFFKVAYCILIIYLNDLWQACPSCCLKNYQHDTNLVISGGSLAELVSLKIITIL